MGLVDLLTDLENFKFGMSSQEQVNEQIESSPSITNVVSSVSKQIEINKKIEFRNGQFTQVPAGLNENNLFGIKTFREVADPHNIASFRQPFILRPIPTEGDGTPGNGRWGFDPIPADSGIGGFLGEAASEFIGGFFRGAPTFTGLVERHLTDKLRIGKFLLTPKGMGFIGKQFALQALNPTLESKVYNPMSTLNIPLGVITDPEGIVQEGGIGGLATLLAAVALPIAHTERHIGHGRYEKIILESSRLQFQARAFSTVIEVDFPDPPKLKTGFGLLDNYVNNKAVKIVKNAESTLTAASVIPDLILSDPNRYVFPVSSAPKTVKDGRVSFIATADQLAKDDAIEVLGKKGSVFNKETNTSDGSHGHSNVNDTKLDRYSTLSYGQLQKAKAYMTGSRAESQENKDVGNPSYILEKTPGDGGWTYSRELGIVKKDKSSYITPNVDKINMTPYGASTMMDRHGKTLYKDFIKFKFEDMVNNKWIVFRAILEGISDSISPDYGEERYIGRPDKVYVYQGADRNISFGFSIYPKTKQELPVLMEKLNYLVGLCYPSYTEGERMKTPFMSLTLGDMFNRAPGVLSSLSITVEDNTTWELDDGLQFPHYIKAQCEFKYIGNNVLASKGKHYGIGWMKDKPFGDEQFPPRDSAQIDGKSVDMSELFFDLGQDNKNITRHIPDIK